LASYENYLKALQSLAVASLGIFAGSCLFSTNAFADACSDLKSQYSSAFQIYQSSKFQFPEDCARAHDYFRSKREQAQSLVSVFHAAKQACGSQFDKGPPPEQLAELFEHDAVTLETGCNLIAGTPATAPAPPPPPPLPVVGAAPVIAAPPPSQASTAPPSNQTAAQSCAAQRTMPIASGCNADFPQLVAGAACTAIDNSVGLTLQTPRRETTCCVTSCGRSK
jgi:hypothetical protein